MSNNGFSQKAKKSDVRKLALSLLRSYEEGQRYVNLLLSSPILNGLTREDKSALTALLYTTVEHKLTYDYFIGSFAKRSLDKIDPTTKDILRLGLCQILHMDSIPDFAAVNETVKLTRNPGERGFVNGVLRAAVRAKEQLPYPDRAKNEQRYLSVYYSVPMPLVKHFVSMLGVNGTERLLKAFSKEAPLSLTVNTNKLTRAEFIEKHSALGAKASPYSSRGVIIEAKTSPVAIDGFADGEFFVQDEASRLAVEALEIEPSQTVIDVCSAPGGKSFAAAVAAGGEGRVYSFDLHQSKLSLIDSGAARLGLNNVTVDARDATLPDEALFGVADRVICDVPCSGLGVLSKKPDIRYKELDSVKELPSLQYSILNSSAKYLKPGGVLVYSTCTLNPCENEEITDKFISENHGFSYEQRRFGELCTHDGKLTLYPHIHGTDGFYIAVMRKCK